MSDDAIALGGPQTASTSPARLRVLVVTAYYHPAVAFGGPVVSVRNAVRGLVEAGMEVRVLTTAANRPRDDRPRTEVVDGVEVEYHPRLGQGDFFLSPSLMRSVARWVQWADVVHTQGVWTFPNLAACLAARLAGKPYVMTPRGSLDAWALRRGAAKKKVYLALVERPCLRGAGAVQCLTRAEKRDVETVAPGARCTVIPNSVDPAEVRARPGDRLTGSCASLEGKQIALFLSRVHPKKGIDVLLAAVERLGPRWPDLHLVIAGPGEEPTGTHLRQRIRERRLEGRVTLAGLVAGDSKRALLRAATVFVLPSFSEGLPMAVLEALAAGVPVVVSAQCNLTDELLDARAGWVVKPEAGEVAAAIERVLGDRDEARRMGENAMRLAQARFSLQAVAARTVALYRRLVRHRGPQTWNEPVDDEAPGAERVPGASGTHAVEVEPALRRAHVGPDAGR